MSETVIFLNFALAIAGIVLLGVAAALFGDIFFNNKKYFGEYVRRYGLVAALVLTVGSSAMTLVYSDIFGFVPCGLCWFQRIFLYPQAFILGTAYFIKDKAFALYGIVLSIPGLLVALYQHYIQMGGSEIVGCPTSGGDCGQRILYEFGFMTYPLMSAALFLVLIGIYFYFLPKK